VDGKVAAVALAEHGTFHVSRLEFATPCYGFTIRSNDPLRDVEASAIALRQSQYDNDVVALGGPAQFLRPRAVIGQRVVKIR
jgi:hypothetical protein